MEIFLILILLAIPTTLDYLSAQKRTGAEAKYTVGAK